MSRELTITVLAINEPKSGNNLSLHKVMDNRLAKFASEMQSELDVLLEGEQDCDDLVVWISYTSNYAIRWKIVNDVPTQIEKIVYDLCAKLGYIIWKGSIISVKRNS
ncbi:hypothetical protein [Pedobacter sp. JCM 36344]|uniref:hypothetical protein n=1 Tax=Pedobacter sp. JCM 36344 TaxID=3374280 RepID=UPI00397A33F8